MNKALANRWFIFLLIALILVVFVQVRVSFPPFHTKIVENLYDEVDRLPRDSFVLLSFDYAPGTDAELTPMARALLYHIFKKHLHLLAVCYVPEGANLMTDTIRQVALKMNKKENRDYVILGTLPGIVQMNNIITMGEDFHQAFPKTRKIPILLKVHNFKDISMVVDITPGSSLDTWILFGEEKFGVKVAGAVTGVMATDYYQYFQAGQIQGLLGGLSGAFQYESLLGKPYERFHQTAFGTIPLGQKRMVPQVFVHAAILLLIVAGNILYFVGKRKRT